MAIEACSLSASVPRAATTCGLTGSPLACSAPSPSGPQAANRIAAAAIAPGFITPRPHGAKRAEYRRAALAAQFTHRRIEPGNGQRKHAVVADDLAHHLDRGGVVPVRARRGIEPDHALVDLRH